MDRKRTDRSVLRIYVVPGAGLTYGQGSVATGTYFSLRGGGVGFRGLLLQSSSCVPVAAAGRVKLWRFPVSGDPRTARPPRVNGS